MFCNGSIVTIHFILNAASLLPFIYPHTIRYNSNPLYFESAQYKKDKHMENNTIDDYTFETMASFVGKELGVSSWVNIDQDRINAFADCTGDHQWIHVDIEKCKTDSPLGKTIAHGYLTLSLLPMLLSEVRLTPEGVTQVLNYGADKIRFIHPVPVNSNVRLRATLGGFTDKGNGRYLVKTICTIEIEGVEKPAMVAETLSMLFA